MAKSLPELKLDNKSCLRNEVNAQKDKILKPTFTNIIEKFEDNRG